MADIEFDVRAGVGHVLLNRPAALNALTLDMCLALDQRLQAWAQDAVVRTVVVRGAGDRAFCAGGDIRRLYDEGRAGGAYARDFYWHEYRLVRRIKTFPKPYIALLDGIVMGGGVGVSVHGGERIVTERTRFAMPETGIGMFPDVGGSYFLPRLRGGVGLHLGLTGEQIGPADCLAAGIATAFVPRKRLDRLLAAIEQDTDWRHLAEDPGPPGATPPDYAAAPDLPGKSPTALRLAWEQLHRGARLDFDECLRMEWRMVNRVMDGHDFYEGVRALIIDKDRTPLWRPPRIGDVTDALIAPYFAPLPGRELRFD